MSNEREICLDIETTGLDPKDGHRIIEIACVELIDKTKTGNVFHSYVNPSREVPKEAIAIHGITTEFLQDKPLFHHITYKFLDFIKDAKLIIHNAAFDTKFINYELNILNIPQLDNTKIIDSLLIARSKFPGAQNSLDALCKRFGIDLSKRTKHGALLDSELLIDVYLELMGGAQKALFTNQNQTSFHNNKTGKIDHQTEKEFEKINQEKRQITKRNFAVSQDYLKKHEEFIKNNFPKYFWEF
jgi:DNA polymerase-3 subunit epsilon